MEVWDGVAMTGGELKRLMRMARRRGRWYRALKRDDRNYMYLVVKVISKTPTKRLYSLVVARLLPPIVRKLLEAVGGVIALMGQAAHQVARFDSKMRRFYLRLKRRRGRQRAIVAVARKMLVSVYHVLKRRSPTTAR